MDDRAIFVQVNFTHPAVIHVDAHGVFKGDRKYMRQECPDETTMGHDERKVSMLLT